MELEEALQNTCRMSLAELESSPGGYHIRTSKQELRIRVEPRRFATELTFRGPWRSPKGMLIKKLIAKQFEPFIPRLRVRLKRTR